LTAPFPDATARGVSVAPTRAVIALRALAPVVLLASIAGCATVSLQQGEVPPVADAAFTADGRISARHGSEGVTAAYHWQHAPPRDDVELASPLGQMVAELTGDASAGYARVRLSDGRTAEAGDWTTLTRQALGVPLPIAGLGAWMRGGPHAASSHQAEVDAAGRVQLLRQDGWEIVYTYAGDARRPSTLRLRYPDVEVRLSVDRFE
jgi:outer membrane lipoprotein LolB